jgi:hypothetical protein
VAEGARLESVYTGNRIVGSNPTPSATPRREILETNFFLARTPGLKISIVLAPFAQTSGPPPHTAPGADVLSGLMSPNLCTAGIRYGFPMRLNICGFRARCMRSIRAREFGWGERPKRQTWL